MFRNLNAETRKCLFHQISLSLCKNIMYFCGIYPGIFLYAWVYRLKWNSSKYNNKKMWKKFRNDDGLCILCTSDIMFLVHSGQNVKFWWLTMGVKVLHAYLPLLLYRNVGRIFCWRRVGLEGFAPSHVYTQFWLILCPVFDN